MTGRKSMKTIGGRGHAVRLGFRSALWLILAAVAGVSASIGPDSYGLVANDATPYSFVDISKTGVKVLAGADDDTALVNIGFAFTFYGKAYTGVCISSNGLLSFGGCNSEPFNADLTAVKPSGDFPTIAPLWSDLTFAAQGQVGASVCYQMLGQTGSRQFVVQWQNAYPVNETKGVTFQVILYESAGKILFQYLTVDTGANSLSRLGKAATIGIRDTGGQSNGRRLQWSYKAAALQDEKAILFQQNVGSPRLSGTVAAKGVDSNNNSYVDLKITNSGTGTAKNISIGSIKVQAVSGTGTVSLKPVSLPIVIGSLEPGASSTIRLYLVFTGALTRYSISESGTYQDLAGKSSPLSLTQSVVP